MAGFALLPAGVPDTAVVVGVAGALLAGRRLSRRISEDVIRLDQQDGLRANLTASLLVGAGAGYVLPMSTTHVATGAIPGVAGVRTSRLNLATLRDFALAWTLTPAVGGLLAAITYLLVRG